MRLELSNVAVELRELHQLSLLYIIILKSFVVNFLDKELSRFFSCLKPGGFTIGSPSSKYEHRQTPALLRNIRKIRICLGKKLIVSVTYENERILIKNSLPYLKYVLRLSCVYKGNLYIYIKTHKTAITHRRDVTHILSKVSFFLLKSFHFRRLQKR